MYNPATGDAVMLNVIALFAGHVAPTFTGVQMRAPAASNPVTT